jgi:hypothetical protein
MRLGTFSFAEEFPDFRDLHKLINRSPWRTCNQVFDEYLQQCESRLAKHDELGIDSSIIDLLVFCFLSAVLLWTLSPIVCRRVLPAGCVREARRASFNRPDRGIQTGRRVPARSHATNRPLARHWLGSTGIHLPSCSPTVTLISILPWLRIIRSTTGKTWRACGSAIQSADLTWYV